jgi:hypothetical protein
VTPILTAINCSCAQKPARKARNALPLHFDKTYGTAWGTEIILATAGTPFVLNTKSILAGSDNQVTHNRISRNVVDGVLVQKSGNKNASRNHVTFNTIDENSSDTTSFGNGGCD